MKAGNKTTSAYLNKLPGKYNVNQAILIKCQLKHTQLLNLEKAKNIRPKVINLHFTLCRWMISH